MRVAAVQFKPDKADLCGARQALGDLAAQAAQDSDLVVLPEMAATGYIFDSREEVAGLAEPARGPTFQLLSDVASRARCWMVAGFPEREGERLFNSAMVVDPTGELAFIYRKTMLYDADVFWASPGDSGYRRFETPSGAFGVGICMDLNDPRFVMWCWRSRLDAIAFPTNWVEEGVDVWPYWMGRIAGSGAALVAANTYGVDGDVEFSGRSAILQGTKVLAGAATAGDEVIRSRLA